MRRKTGTRRGAAAVELAILLPFLAFIFVIAVDWARIFYFSVIVTNAARAGAYWAADPTTQPNSPYTSVTAAALADAQDLKPAPSVNANYGSDSNGSYVDVTVAYTFQTISQFPGVPNSTNVQHTVRMRVLPSLPAN
jgi:Flp pilus assembly protein TadG